MWPKSRRCAVWSSKNKPSKKTICEECSFIKDFVIKFGRENLRQIVTTYTTPYLSRKASHGGTNSTLPTTSITNNNSCTPAPCNTCNVPTCTCHARAAAAIATAHMPGMPAYGH